MQTIKKNGRKYFVPAWWGEMEIERFKSRKFTLEKAKTIRVQGDEIPFTEMREMKEALGVSFRSRKEHREYKKKNGLTQDSVEYCRYGKTEKEKKQEHLKRYDESLKEAKRELAKKGAL